MQANIEERKKAAEKIEMMIESEIVDFNQWINLLGVVPVISSLREKSLSIQRETMESIERKLPHLSERDKKSPEQAYEKHHQPNAERSDTLCKRAGR